MLVSVRARERPHLLRVEIPLDTTSVPHQMEIEKAKIDSCIQMLHEDESSVLASDTTASVQIKNVGNNNFRLTFQKHEGSQRLTVCEGQISALGVCILSDYPDLQTIPQSVKRLLAYSRNQVIPVYATAAAVTEKIQGVFGSVLPKSVMENNSLMHHSRADDAFFRNNASTVSKLLDMFNAAGCNGHFKPMVAARMVMLAAIFSATAPATDKGNMFHVSQLTMTDMSDEMSKTIYDTEPEKQHVTVLLRGENAENRIKRFNVAVRLFGTKSEFVHEMMPRSMGLNAKLYSPVMVLTGVFNKQAAAIFLSSESMSENVHCVALNMFAAGLNTNL